MVCTVVWASLLSVHDRVYVIAGAPQQVELLLISKGLSLKLVKTDLALTNRHSDEVKDEASEVGDW